MCIHLQYAPNDGTRLSAITVFPPRQKEDVTFVCGILL